MADRNQSRWHHAAMTGTQQETMPIPARRRVAETILGSRLAGRVACRAYPGLRILAYHELSDLAAVGRHLDILADYQPVSAEDVVAGRKLPKRAVWVTFDDGHPATVDAADWLAARGISATAFVCPSVVGGRSPLWFQLADEAKRRGLIGSKEALKQMPDRDRRALLDGLGLDLEVEQTTEAALRGWVAAGHTIGNHTWDHPLLDHCSDEEQRAQVALAHVWIEERFPGQPRVLAYPNGNWAMAAAAEAQHHQYLTLLFDHRVARAVRDGRPVSRLRVDADASPRRFRAIVSGAHSAAFRFA